tara:strand:+ start:144 stop:632 length:489 start_codon:yes stop_codon:yes gene_type:complete
VIIGVTGDTHNNLKNITEICTIFNKNNTDFVFHTGDISLPKSLLSFKKLNCPLIVVLGNNDIGEKNGLVQASKSFNCRIVEEPFSLCLDNRKIVILHHPELISEEMLASNDFIFHGHTHRYRLETFENSLIFNPGECAGFMKGKNKVGIVDLKTKEAKTISF